MPVLIIQPARRITKGSNGTNIRGLLAVALVPLFILFIAAAIVGHGRLSGSTLMTVLSQSGQSLACAESGGCVGEDASSTLLAERTRTP